MAGSAHGALSFPTRDGRVSWCRATREATRGWRAAVDASWRDGSARWARRHTVAPGTSGARPATWSGVRPAGRCPAPPMPAPPRPRRTLVVDLDRHHSMRQGRLATPMPMDSAAHSGKRARPWGVESAHAGVPERVPVWGPFPSTKEAFRMVHCANRQRTWWKNEGDRARATLDETVRPWMISC
jgi:hypothetical protein